AGKIRKVTSLVEHLATFMGDPVSLWINDAGVDQPQLAEAHGFQGAGGGADIGGAGRLNKDKNNLHLPGSVVVFGEALCHGSQNRARGRICSPCCPALSFFVQGSTAKVSAVWGRGITTGHHGVITTHGSTS